MKQESQWWKGSLFQGTISVSCWTGAGPWSEAASPANALIDAAGRDLERGSVWLAGVHRGLQYRLSLRPHQTSPASIARSSWGHTVQTHCPSAGVKNPVCFTTILHSSPTGPAKLNVNSLCLGNSTTAFWALINYITAYILLFSCITEKCIINTECALTCYLKRLRPG